MPARPDAHAAFAARSHALKRGATRAGHGEQGFSIVFKMLTVAAVPVCARPVSPVMMRPELFSVSTPL